MTKNATYNDLLVRWDADNAECDECGRDMTGRNVIEGKWGWYCSRRCRKSSETAYYGLSDTECRRSERQQMGIC